MNYLCFSPRDALVFYDEEGEIVGSVVICFTCFKSRISPAALSKNLDYGRLAAIFGRAELPGGYSFEKKGVASYAKEYEGRLAKSLAKLAESRGRPVISERWKVAKPQDDVKILPGDEVYISSDRQFDSCDGKLKVDPKGFVTPKCGSGSVKIGGLSEVEASRIVAELLVRDEIYHPSTKVKVVNASRFPDEK